MILHSWLGGRDYVFDTCDPSFAVYSEKSSSKYVEITSKDMYISPDQPLKELLNPFHIVIKIYVPCSYLKQYRKQVKKIVNTWTENSNAKCLLEHVSSKMRTWGIN